jgi:hypothetical protein
VDDDFSSRSRFDGRNRINPASAETQVSDRPRNRNAVGWEATDPHLAAAEKSRAAPAFDILPTVDCAFGLHANNVWTIDVPGVTFSHVYKIVCRA